MTPIQITGFIIIGILFVFLVFSLILLSGKGAFLIAGYNTSSKAEKVKYKSVEFSKFMEKMMLIQTVTLLIPAYAIYKEVYAWFILYIVVFTIHVTYILIVSNSKRFKKEVEHDSVN